MQHHRKIRIGMATLSILTIDSYLYYIFYNRPDLSSNLDKIYLFEVNFVIKSMNEWHLLAKNIFHIYFKLIVQWFIGYNRITVFDCQQISRLISWSFIIGFHLLFIFDWIKFFFNQKGKISMFIRMSHTCRKWLVKFLIH